jgi:hypothetical protein
MSKKGNKELFSAMIVGVKVSGIGRLSFGPPWALVTRLPLPGKEILPSGPGPSFQIHLLRACV